MCYGEIYGVTVKSSVLAFLDMFYLMKRGANFSTWNCIHSGHFYEKSSIYDNSFTLKSSVTVRTIVLDTLIFSRGWVNTNDKIKHTDSCILCLFTCNVSLRDSAIVWLSEQRISCMSKWDLCNESFCVTVK